jgi:methyl-accepting chemotaxis protein
MDTNSHIKTRLGIRGRLIIGFGAIILLFIMSLLMTIMLITQSKSYIHNVTDVELPTYDAFIDLSGIIYHSQSTLRGLIVSNSSESKKEFVASVNLLAATVTRIDALPKNNWTNQELSDWAQSKKIIMEIIAQYDLVKNISDIKPNNLIILSAINKTKDLSNNLLELADGPLNARQERTGGLLDAQYNKLAAGSYGLINNMNNILLTEYVVLSFSVFFTILIVFLTSRSIVKHINLFREHSNRIASGDLRQTLDIYGTDEIAKLGSDLNSMTENLSSITKQIATASHNMVSTLEEVKQAVNVQSAGASQQASSINEVTASLEEIEKSSEQTMEKAKVLGNVAERTREKGQLGLESVEKSIQGMKSVRDKVQLIAQTILELSNQTQQVGEITAVVTSLAQQSKMLALNASIEAAKAGDAGKGFAVVASEVKNLAEQSEQSTTQVQKILEDIRHATEKAVMVTEEGTKGVDYGTSLVEKTGEIVRGLSDVIYEATLASQQIEAAVRQEGVGIEQITAGMNEINQVTASFVSSSKQTLEAITQISDISKQLKERVDSYKI